MTDEIRRGRPRLGLVIGAGGLKGAAAIGLLRALEREGINVDMAVGCSAGSLYTSTLALGWSVERIEEATYKMWDGLFARHDYGALARAIVPSVFPFDEQFALIDDSRVNGVVETLFGDQTFADTRIPLHLAATDLHSGERVILNEGSIREAVRASIALPLILRPARLGGRLLVDGAVSDPLPIDVAIREDCQIIVAMGFLGALTTRISSLAGLIEQATNIVVRNLLKSEFAFYTTAHDSEIIPIMVTFDRPVAMGDTNLLPYVIEQGIKATEKQMPYLRRVLNAT